MTRTVSITRESIARKLAVLEERYRHELMPEGERLELRERILKLRTKLTADLDAHYSGLDRLRD